MNILIYTESYYPNLGGLERNTDILAHVLSENHQVIILTPIGDSGLTDKTPFKVIRTNQILTFKKLVKNTDLLIINGGIALKVAVWALLFKKPFWAIYQMANLFFQADQTKLKGRLNNKIRELFASKAQLNIAVSKYSSKDLRKYFKPTRVTYLINPLDSKLESIIKVDDKTTKKTPLKFLFVGRLIEGKGIYLLIEAFTKIEKKYYDSVELHIAGSGPEEENIKNLQISPRIFYHGRVEGAELLNLYKMAHLCIIPSHSHIEGSPLVIAESLFSRTPLLVSNQPAMIDSVGKAGFSFISGDVESLFLAIHKFIIDLAFREALNTNCIIESEKFSFINYKNKVNNLIKVHFN